MLKEVVDFFINTFQILPRHVSANGCHLQGVTKALCTGVYVLYELSYLAPLGSEKICPKTEITNILFYILNFASVIKFKM
jgi:hypothetical protein